MTSMDFRGHGDTKVDGPPFKWTWQDYGYDVLAVTNAIYNKYKTQQIDRKNVKIFGVGLSKGAASLAMAEVISRNYCVNIIYRHLNLELLLHSFLQNPYCHQRRIFLVEKII